MNQKVSPFLQPHSAIVRIWHWLTFILILISIFTVIINSTLLDPRANGKVVQEQLIGQNISLDDRQSFFIAHHFDDQLWNLHKYIGIGIAFLLLVRIAAEFSIPAEERTRTRLLSALKTYRSDKEGNKEYRHYLIVRTSYTLFYILLLFLSISGLIIAFGRNIGIEAQAVRSFKELHETGQWLVYAFVIFHIGGVVISETGKVKGIVSGMINGNK
ncbi:MAG: cytochrome b/b6 domain-containing protein [Bacteroidales bacterium]